MGYWGSGKRVYHHTAPINLLYGLHEALAMLQEEGLENSWARHRHQHLALRSGIEAMGLSLLVHESARLPQLNAIVVPEGVDEAVLRSRLLNEYNLKSARAWAASPARSMRIGLMGYGAKHENVMYCLEALEAVLAGHARPIRTGVAMNAAQNIAVHN
jgi:alanine-glyoxylate transaminase/serine-glyoxylate transaminase/serine-pyruvate transaminase